RRVHVGGGCVQDPLTQIGSVKGRPSGGHSRTVKHRDRECRKAPTGGTGARERIAIGTAQAVPVAESSTLFASSWQEALPKKIRSRTRSFPDQRSRFPDMNVAKAHAYGNDFLFVPADEAEGLALDQLSRRLCERYTGVGGDGVIFYTAAPDGTARMRLLNADGSPSELSGNGLRCLAALILHQRGTEAEPLTTLRVDTDAGWKTLTLAGRTGSRYTFRAAMGAPERITQETLQIAGEPLEVVIMTMANPQCVT